MDELPAKDVEIKEYVRDTDLTELPMNVAYRVMESTFMLYILNLVATLNVTDYEGETCHKQTLRSYAGGLAAGSSRFSAWAETPHVEWRPAVVSAILVTGLFATALAFTIQAWAQQYTTPTRTALIYTLEPVVAWATSYLLAGEGLTRRAAAGAALILGGVLLVELKPLSQR